jgi:hypothetical protein
VDAVGDLVAEVVRIRAVEGNTVKSLPPDCPGVVFGNRVMAGHWVSGPMARGERPKASLTSPHRIDSTIVQIEKMHLPEIVGWMPMERIRP